LEIVPGQVQVDSRVPGSRALVQRKPEQIPAYEEQRDQY